MSYWKKILGAFLEHLQVAYKLILRSQIENSDATHPKWSLLFAGFLKFCTITDTLRRVSHN